DSYGVPAGTSEFITNVLANDSDPDGDPLTVRVITAPANGASFLQTDGTLIYEPDAGFHGADTFSYVVTDGTFESAPATVTLNVDTPPVAVNDSYGVPAGTSEFITNVLANDSDPDGDPL